MSPSPGPADSAAGVSPAPRPSAGPGTGPDGSAPEEPGPEEPGTEEPGTEEGGTVPAAPDQGAGEPPHAQPQRRRTDVFAVVALISGILPLVPLALAAGLAGLSRTAGGRRAGRPAAIGGLVLAGAWAVAGTVAAVMFLVPGPAPRPQLPHHTVFLLRAGQCADTARNGVTGAHAVPCSQPHQLEVYATYRLSAKAWPGAAAASRHARQGCLARLGSYLNPDLVGTSLRGSYIYPNRAAWKAGERTVVCEIRSTTGQLKGSVRGLGQTPG